MSYAEPVEHRINHYRGLVYTFGEWEHCDELADLYATTGRHADLVMLVEHLADHGDTTAPRLLDRLTPAGRERATALLTTRADDGEQEAAHALAILRANP